MNIKKGGDPYGPTEVHRLPRVCYLKALSGETPGKVFSISRKTIIGRRSDCHIVVNVKGVSRQHAVIEVQGKDYVLKDLDSANGTFVNGRRIKSVLLEPGDEIAFDEVRFAFKAVSAPSSHAEYSSALQAAEGESELPEEIAIDRSKPKAPVFKIAGIAAVFVAIALLIIGIWYLLKP